MRQPVPSSPVTEARVGPLLLHACFFCTGFAGLVLELCWSKSLGYLLGNSIYGIATVVASFLGGLGIGAAIGGRVAARARAPIVLYAALEAVVGVLAIVSPFALRAAHPLFAALYDPLSGSPTAFFLVRFSILFAALLIPTVAMGASLPLVVEQLARRGVRESDPIVGRLYAINTAGGVTGVVLAGFALLPSLGLAKTAWLAGAVDLSVAAVLLSRRTGAAPAAAARAPSGANAAARSHPAPRGGRFAAPAALLFAAVSGFTAILYQVAWTRILAVPFGGMVYAFSAILATYLAGLALGAAGAARILRRSRAPLAFFGLLQLALAGAVASGAHVFDRLPHMMTSVLASSGGSASALFGGEAAIAALIVFVPTLLLGASFPAAVAIFRGGHRDAGAAVGSVYAANTAGSIAGSLLTAFTLIPAIGALGSVLLGAALNVALGVIAILPGGARNRTARAAAAVAALAATGFYAVVAVPAWNPERQSMGFVRLLRAYAFGGADMTHRVIDAAGTAPEYGRLLFYREGRAASVAVIESSASRALLINGKADATIGQAGDMATQLLLGHIPLVGTPDARDVCLVGFGSGVSTRAILTHPVRYVLTLELEEAVVEAGRYFRDWNYDPERDPRSELRVEDAGAYLRSTRRTFDAVISQPSNLWIAGMANLFTRDFYQAVRARLRPGGVFCQWMQCYDTSPETVQTVFRTVASVFPRGRVYYLEDSADLLLVAFGDAEIPLGDPRREAAFAEPRVAADLASLGLHGEGQLLPLYRGRLERFARDAGPGPIHTDDNGWLEYRAPFDLLAHRGAEDLLSFNPASAADVASEFAAAPARGDSLLAEAALHAREHGQIGIARGLDAARAELANLSAGGR